MLYKKEMEKLHAVIIVDSDGRNNNSRSPTDFQFQMTQPITFYKRSKNKQYFVRVENVRIPVSFYNINSDFDTFAWDSNSIAATGFTITHGNYTIDELIAEIQVQMNADSVDANTYTITYDEITQKVNIANDNGGTGTIDTLTGDGWQTIGFVDGGSESIANNANLDGTNVAYTNTAQHLKILVDGVNSGNVYANELTTTNGIKNTNIQRVGLNIPVIETRNEFIFFLNHNGYKMKMPNIPTLNNFNVLLMDARNNVIDLNGVPWSFDLVFYELNTIPWGNGGTTATN